MLGNNVLSEKDKTVYTPSIADQLNKIKEQWDPSSANCKLKTHFYNKVNENDLQVLLNQPRPANESPDDWNKAMSERPSNQYYPVKITSVSDMSSRVETQLDHVKKSRYLLNLINDNQIKLSSKHDLENSDRIKGCKAKHVKLSRRLLRLATILAILKLKGYPLSPEEEEISKHFEMLSDKLNDPNNSLSKLNDLFARLTILKEKSEHLDLQFNSSITLMNENLMDKNLADSNVNELEVNNNEELITKISKLLLKQQKGLNYVNEVLHKDLDLADKLK
ncbi:Nucleoporin nup57 [Yamadazyma tenuis]|uniref:Nucleoporin nup57 n=1 Tax=Candida tenuis TaxID=2315449 RepID=UPI0027A42317|nr:Nucleoporin nup57 [Yamadazyma tenuis]